MSTTSDEVIRASVRGVPRRAVFDTAVWQPFCVRHGDLLMFFEETTERLIREAVHGDTTDAEVVPEALAPR